MPGSALWLPWQDCQPSGIHSPPCQYSKQFSHRGTPHDAQKAFVFRTIPVRFASLYHLQRMQCLQTSPFRTA